MSKIGQRIIERLERHLDATTNTNGEKEVTSEYECENCRCEMDDFDFCGICGATMCDECLTDVENAEDDEQLSICPFCLKEHSRATDPA